MNSGIYHIRNLVDGTLYVGSSVSLKRRFRDHRALLRRGVHHNIHLQRAWSRDGEPAFSFDIVAFVAPSECLNAEQKCLDAFVAVGAKVYNISTEAASPNLGTKWSPAIREKLMPKRSVAWNDPARRARLSKTIKAMRAEGSFGPEHSAKMKAYWAGPLGQARKLTRTPLSAEHRINIGAALRGHVKSPETRARLSRAFKGRPLSAEHVANITAAQRARRDRERTESALAHNFSP